MQFAGADVVGGGGVGVDPPLHGEGALTINEIWMKYVLN